MTALRENSPIERVAGALTTVVMAKRPEPNRVKTRLARGGPGVAGADGDPGLAPETVSELAWAFLDCTVRRLARRWPVVLAASPDGTASSILDRLGLEGVEALDQGDGDLGDRLERTWSRLGGHTPIAFFGADSPDVPEGHLDAIGAGLAEADVVVGPATDGGYWTIAARVHVPQLFAHVDWGSENVYDQTRARIRECGLSFGSLPVWHDVDRPQDLGELRSRLRSASGDAAIAALAETLDRLLDTTS